MHKSIICFCALFFTFSTMGFSFQQPTNIYRASDIKEELTKNANTVKRFEKVEIEISGPDKVLLHSHEVITILNEKGKSELDFYVYTSKSHALDDAEIKLYDKNGVQLEKYKKKDFSSQAAGSGLVEDGTIYFINLSTGSFPVTIEKESTERYRGMIQVPRFFFSQPNQSVEYSTLLVKHPTSMKVNYKSFHLKQAPKKTSDDNIEVVQFEASSLPAEKYEENSGPWTKDFPHVLFNSDKITYDGYSGNLSTWKDMGLWYNSLVKNTNRLSTINQEAIRNLVVNAKSNNEKVRILYSYLQNNFRYVSIQLGIGGFKPFPADFVHEKKYGDCKGLSNYMEACLAAVDIKSYSAWIKSGDDETYIDPDFTYDGFDHQILMVPAGKDTIWLECTSNYNEFGHLGSFTENRYALVLTENGGQMIKTPVSKDRDNTISAFTHINIESEGEASMKSVIRSTGEYKYMLINISRESSDYYKKFAVSYFGVGNPDEFEMNFGKKEDSLFNCSIEMSVEKVFDFKAGTKLFIKPRMYKMWQHSLNNTEKRAKDYFLDHPLQKTDTTAFHLPEGFTVETLPKNKSISFPLGKYESSYWVDEKTHTVYSSACLIVNSFKIDPSQYEASRLFFDQVIDDGNQKIILKNNR